MEKLKYDIPIMDTPIACPYCSDREIEVLPSTEVFVKNISAERPIATGEVVHCPQWHIFAIFPQHRMPRR